MTIGLRELSGTADADARRGRRRRPHEARPGDAERAARARRHARRDDDPHAPGARSVRRPGHRRRHPDGARRGGSPRRIGCGSTTAPATTARVAVTSSRTASCRCATAGTSSRSTSTVTTGARSASIVSGRPWPPGSRAVEREAPDAAGARRRGRRGARLRHPGARPVPGAARGGRAGDPTDDRGHREGPAERARRRRS